MNPEAYRTLHADSCRKIYGKNRQQRNAESVMNTLCVMICYHYDIGKPGRQMKGTLDGGYSIFKRRMRFSRHRDCA
jgi:hypothetical protein